jgi:hypothetical protein
MPFATQSYCPLIWSLRHHGHHVGTPAPRSLLSVGYNNALQYVWKIRARHRGPFVGMRAPKFHRSLSRVLPMSWNIILVLHGQQELRVAMVVIVAPALHLPARDRWNLVYLACTRNMWTSTTQKAMFQKAIFLPGTEVLLSMMTSTCLRRGPSVQRQ